MKHGLKGRQHVLSCWAATSLLSLSCGGGDTSVKEQQPEHAESDKIQRAEWTLITSLRSSYVESKLSDDDGPVSSAPYMTVFHKVSAGGTPITRDQHEVEPRSTTFQDWTGGEPIRVPPFSQFRIDLTLCTQVSQGRCTKWDSGGSVAIAATCDGHTYSAAYSAKFYRADAEVTITHTFTLKYSCITTNSYQAYGIGCSALNSFQGQASQFSY